MNYYPPTSAFRVYRKRLQDGSRTARRRRHRVGEGPSIPTPPCSSRNSKALRSSSCERALGGVNVGAVQPRRHASTMLLLFVGVMVQELLLLAEASPLRSTHGRGRHHHCARLSDACAQQNALAEQRHLLLAARSVVICGCVYDCWTQRRSCVLSWHWHGPGEPVGPACTPLCRYRIGIGR